jgi:hypothetical protein
MWKFKSGVEANMALGTFYMYCFTSSATLERNFEEQFEINGLNFHPHDWFFKVFFAAIGIRTNHRTSS